MIMTILPLSTEKQLNQKLDKKININLARYFICLSLCLLSLGAFSEPLVTNNRSGLHPKTNVLIVGGEVNLPGEGTWVIASQDNPALSDISLVVPEAVMLRGLGIRELKKRQKRKRDHEKYNIGQIYYSIERYARNNNGMSPKVLGDTDIVGRFSKEQLDKVSLTQPANILVKNKNNRWHRIKDNIPLLIQLKPLIDDGKHWVTYVNGQTKLVPIDQELVKKYGLKIVAQEKSVEQKLAEISVTAKYQIIGKVKDSPPKSAISISLHNIETGKILKAQWKPEINNESDQELIKEWATARALKWRKMQRTGQLGFLPYWSYITANQYGLKDGDRGRLFNIEGLQRRQGRRTNIFNVLGGRAAIQETLQLQSIGVRQAESESAEISIDTIKGVEVKSHPFKQMLAGKKGGSLELANYVPADRFFAWFEDPKDLLSYINGGSDFIFNASSLFLRASYQYKLKEHYYKKIGVDAKWVELFLRSKFIDELAVVLPDLFLIDGTDITIIMKLKQPRAAKTMLRGLGIKTLDKPVKYSHKGGDSYWVIHNDLLLVSTHPEELDRVGALATGAAKNSLGQSTEFKYMLTQLPIEKKTRSFFYFSDPFIRHLVGPGVKIAQMRRLQARSEMEATIAACLLYKADGNKNAPLLKELYRREYLHHPVMVTDIRLAEDCSVNSKSWGSPADMPTLLEMPVTSVHIKEKKAYENYRSNYTRYWRRFFDPIAIRMNQESKRRLEVTTFILPLIDNSIYQALREMIVAGEDGKKLSVPKLKPDPVAQLSLNLKQTIWDVGKNEFIRDFLVKYVGVPPLVAEYLGPDIHIALGDADPIIVMGSGGLNGAFGMVSNSNNRNFSFMRTIPIIVSLLTRPTVIMVGLTNPEAVKFLLHNMATGPLNNRLMMDLGRGGVYGVSGKDAWLYDLNIQGLMSMRFGIEVTDRFLKISNQPFSYDPEVVSVNNTINNGAALGLSPAAAIQQKPALFASANYQQRRTALAGINLLYPYLVSGTGSVEKATRQVHNQLGFTPVHPGKGKWEWKGGVLKSNVFGYAGKQKLARDVNDEPFGIFQQIERAEINMQFEDDGLRARASWELRK